MPVLHDLFQQFAAVLIVAAATGYVATLLRQPLIVAFIIVGVLVGPAAMGLVAGGDLELLATMGISILLFVVGLKLDIGLIRLMGPVALTTGLGQVFFTSVVGYFLAVALGFTPLSALYVAVALTFSSTIIIVKLLSDKREIDSLHGRVAIGFLIVQDIVVVLVMIGLSAFGEGTEAHNGALRNALDVVLKAGVLLGSLVFFTRVILPRLIHRMARSQELLILFAIAWAIFLAAMGDMAGLSKEVGAFLAGVSLASTPYREAIGGRLVSLRDFLLFFFFIHLGATLDLGLIGAQIAPAIVLSTFVLVGNPLIVMTIMGRMGYRKRTGFLAGLTVAQISEFSLILGALGMSLGHIEPETMGLITLVGLITIGLSTYMILYSHPLYERLAPYLSIFERENPYREQEQDAGHVADAIIFGLGRYGNNIALRLREQGWRVLGVDFDPRVVSAWRKLGLAVQYGDAEDPEFHTALPLAQVRWVVCTMPGKELNLVLLQGLRQHGYRGKVAFTAHHEEDRAAFLAAGADVVLMPFADAADQAVDILMGKPDAGG